MAPRSALSARFGHPERDLTANVSVFAAALAALNAMAASLSLLWLALPHPAGADERTIAYCALIGCGLGAFLLLSRKPILVRGLTSRLRSNEARVRSAAGREPLTALGNRALFADWLDAALAEPDGDPVAAATSSWRPSAGRAGRRSAHGWRARSTGRSTPATTSSR